MKKQKLVVSEPWNFKVENGTNVLLGRVCKRLSSTLLVFELEQELAMHGISGKYLLLSARYQGDHFDCKPYTGTVNGGLLTRNVSDSESVEDVKARATFVLIGSLESGI